jgi:hypothetical protein
MGTLTGRYYLDLTPLSQGVRQEATIGFLRFNLVPSPLFGGNRGKVVIPGILLLQIVLQQGANCLKVGVALLYWVLLGPDHYSAPQEKTQTQDQHPTDVFHRPCCFREDSIAGLA